MRLIYKLLDTASWSGARAAGVFTGSALDRKDGFMHFSDAAQVQETARLYFKGALDLVLLSVDADALGEALKWEPSRDGALFPHLFGVLPVEAVVEARAVKLDAAGAPVLGALR